jgi:nicotinate dehydrogenase subunit A
MRSTRCHLRGPTIAITLKVNGTTHSVDAEPDTPLLYVLRNHLELNGAKYGCGMTQCGVCTVLVTGAETLLRDAGRLDRGKGGDHARRLGRLDKPHPLLNAPRLVGYPY